MSHELAYPSVMPSPSWRLLGPCAITCHTSVVYETTSPHLPPILQSLVLVYIICQHSRCLLCKASDVAALTHIPHCFHCRDTYDMLNASAALLKYLNGLGGLLPIRFRWGCVWHYPLFVPLWN